MVTPIELGQVSNLGLEMTDRISTRRETTNCLGMHLLFMHGYSQNVFAAYKSRTWSRLYSVVLPDPNSYEDIEFAFFFFCRESFTDFCRYAHYMDKVVQSLDWRRP